MPGRLTGAPLSQATLGNQGAAKGGVAAPVRGKTALERTTAGRVTWPWLPLWRVPMRRPLTRQAQRTHLTGLSSAPDGPPLYWLFSASNPFLDNPL